MVTKIPTLDGIMGSEILSSEETEVSVEKVAQAVKAAIPLLEHITTDISSSSDQEDLLSWAREWEPEFIKACPHTVWGKFPKDAAEYLDQVAELNPPAHPLERCMYCVYVCMYVCMYILYYSFCSSREERNLPTTTG